METSYWKFFASASFGSCSRQEQKAPQVFSESLADTPSAQSLYQDFLEKYEPNDNGDARRLRKSLTPAQRRLQQMQNCSIDSCNALTYRASDYCLRHQPSMLEEIVSEPEPAPDPQAEANWWEEKTD
ncbi:MAG: hypothetical protein ACJZ5A_01020 [Candidatus Thalassarchaeaceae archaeon]